MHGPELSATSGARPQKLKKLNLIHLNGSHKQQSAAIFSQTLTAECRPRQTKEDEVLMFYKLFQTFQKWGSGGVKDQH